MIKPKVFCQFRATGDGNEKVCVVCGDRNRGIALPEHTWSVCSGEAGVHMASIEQRQTASVRYQIETVGTAKEKSPDSADAPGYIDKVVGLSKAVRRWISAGRPVRDEDEQRHILTEVCPPCEFIVNGSCSKCGCILKAKVYMDTEKCPLPEPKWVANSGPQAEDSGG